MLPSIISQNFLEKQFWQARQLFGSNFYVDVKDVMVEEKLQRSQQLVKQNVIANSHVKLISHCFYS